MIRRLFLDHPASVGESYFEHFRVASGFGWAMIVGGFGAVLHAIFPFVCKTRGSDTINMLHARLVMKREAKRNAQTQMKSVEYII
ncbi:MAG: hypothetical protein K2P68_10075 [Sphingomonas sp.]|nr:hypothetical protein [Sphingomonas sp.]